MSRGVYDRVDASTTGGRSEARGGAASDGYENDSACQTIQHSHRHIPPERIKHHMEGGDLGAAKRAGNFKKDNAILEGEVGSEDTLMSGGQHLGRGDNGLH